MDHRRSDVSEAFSLCFFERGQSEDAWPTPSWLKDGRRDVIFVQNLETNEVQRITAEPNQNNLRLIALQPNLNPQFVEAVISDGKEQGSVKFRIDVQVPAGPTASPVVQTTNSGAPGQTPNNAQVAPRSVPGLQANPPGLASLTNL
jgi:hypothetical protein